MMRPLPPLWAAEVRGLFGCLRLHVPPAALKQSAADRPFGVPTPVTLSQPFLVRSAEGLLQGVPLLPGLVANGAEQSVPNDSEKATSSAEFQFHMALIKDPVRPEGTPLKTSPGV